MKKVIYILLIILVCPLIVYADTSKEFVDDIINNIENVQVDDNIILEKVVKNDSTINFQITNNGLVSSRELNYIENDKMIEFSSGKVLLLNTNGVLSSDIEDNELAFYLYSIIENKADTEYDINTYFNSNNIEEKLLNIDPTLYQSLIGGETDKLEFTDNSNTFNLILEVLNMDNNTIEFQIKYRVLFNNSENNISMREASDFKNPETGSMNFYITITLLFVVGLLGYSLIYSDNSEGV